MARSRSKSPKRKAVKRKSPKKSPKKRGRSPGFKLSSATKAKISRSRMLNTCFRHCEKEVKQRISPTPRHRAKSSARRSRAAANPWVKYMKSRQHEKPAGMAQSAWLKKIKKDY